MSSYGDRPLVLVIDDPSALPDQIWQALDAAGARADSRLLRALHAGDAEEAERVLGACGPALVAEHPGLLARWHGDAWARENAGPRLQWALWLDGGVLPRPLGRERGPDRLLARALRCEVSAVYGAMLEKADPRAIAVAVQDAPQQVREALGPWRAAVHAACARQLTVAGRTEEALTTLAEGLSVAGDTGARRELSGLAVFVAAVHGDLVEARRHRQTVPEVFGAHRIDPTLAAADALVALEGGDHAEARRILERAGDRHRDLRMAKAFLLVAEGRSQEAAAVRSTMSGSHPLLRALDDATISGSAGASPRLVDLSLAQDAPRVRLHAAVRDFAATRRFASPTTVALLAQRVADLAAMHGMTWPLGLLDAADSEVLAGLIGRHAPSFLSAPAMTELTDAELDVLRELATGGTEAQIARRVFRSVNTIKTQRRSLYRKLGVSNRADAVALAVQWGVAPARRGVNPG